MRWLVLTVFMIGCASPERAPEARTAEVAPAHQHAIRPEPSFAAKRLAAESGALNVAEVRFLGGESEPGPLARHELAIVPPEAKRAQVLAWADAPYGQGEAALGAARGKAVCDQLATLSCETFNMAEKAGLFSRMLFLHAARVKVAGAAAAPEEASRAIVLYFR